MALLLWHTRMIFMKQIFTTFLVSLMVVMFAQGQTYDVTNYSAVGDGSTLNTVAIQEAVDSCYANGGGTVLVPSGTFLTGTIILKDNVMLEIADGGELRGSTDPNDYPQLLNQLPTYTLGYPQMSIVYAQNAHHVGITGEGTLNGQGVQWQGSGDGPYGMRFLSCQNVLIEGVKLRHTAFWMMHNFNCDSVIIRNIDILNFGSAHCDGLSIDGCRNVIIENNICDSGNDPLVMKATGPYNCENVIARNNTLSTHARAIKIGTETNGGFKNIHIHDCYVVWSSVSVPGVIGEAACGLNLSIVDGGFAEDVLVEDCTLEGVSFPFMIRLGNRARQYDDTIPITTVGSMKGITVKNVEFTAQNNVPALISGLPDHYVEDVLMQNLTFNLPGGTPPVPLDYNVPESEADKPDCDMFGDIFPSSGVYARHVDGLVLDNVCFKFDANDQRQLIFFTDVLNSETYTSVDGQNGERCSAIDTEVAEISGKEVKVWYDSNNSQLVFDELVNTSATLVVYDRAGRLVFETTLLSNRTNLAQLESGFYTWQLIENGQRLGSGKFIN